MNSTTAFENHLPTYNLITKQIEFLLLLIFLPAAPTPNSHQGKISISCSVSVALENNSLNLLWSLSRHLTS